MDEEKFYSEEEYNSLKSRLEQSEQDFKNFQYKSAVSSFVKSLELENDIYEKHLCELIISNDIQFENNSPVGADELINDFKANYPAAFKSANKSSPFTAPTGNSAPPQLSGIEAAFLRKNPNIKF